MEVENGWDPDFLRSLHTMTLEEAREKAIDLLEAGTTKPTKKAHLKRDFMRARSAAEVSRIMYNAMLVGSGLGIQGSDWQRLHGSSK